MTITLEGRTIAGAPVLLARDAQRPDPRPAVLWYHGFSVEAATHETELKRFASAGLLAVGVDAVAHGNRRRAGFEQWFAGSGERFETRFVEVVRESVAEVPSLVNALIAEGLTDATSLAVAGISMGGFIAYGAIAEEPRIRSAFVLLGSPRWQRDPSPADVPERFCDVALLSINAQCDVNVRPAAARAFHEQLDRTCGSTELRRYVELPGETHFLSEEAWRTTITAGTDWLVRWTGSTRNER
jgi:dipeptidyl aminopeptidase/acylaminoacyl peptidase